MQWPQANGEAERFMRTLNRALKIGLELGEDAECCLHKFLPAYQQIPHSTMNWDPENLLFRKQTQDSILADTEWRPADMDVEATQSRRKATNEKASQCRRANPLYKSEHWFS